MFKEIARIDCGVIACAATRDDEHRWTPGGERLADQLKTPPIGNQSSRDGDRFDDLGTHDRLAGWLLSPLVHGPPLRRGSLRTP